MKRRSAGFTLAEMAIVLVVVGLLLTSVLSTVSTQLEARNIAETQTRLNLIKDALIGFAQANGRLPCPADGTIATGASNAGLEVACASAGSISRGVVPWATLGIVETDVWGRRFSYYVDQNFGDTYAQTTANPNPSWGCGASVPSPAPASPTSFGLCATGALIVKTRTASNKTGTSVSSIPVVIISHGKNGYGAYTPRGTQFTAPPAVNADETANTPAAASTTLYSREQSPQTSTCSDTAANTPFCEFDDLIAYVPFSVLATRMVSAGKLP